MKKKYNNFICEILKPITVSSVDFLILKETDLSTVDFSNSSFRSELKTLLPDVNEIRFILVSRKVTPTYFKLVSAYFWESSKKTHDDVVQFLTIRENDKTLKSLYSNYLKNPNTFWSKDPHLHPSSTNFIFAEVYDINNNLIISKSSSLLEITKENLQKVFAKQGIFSPNIL